MILWLIFVFVFGASMGFAAGMGWRAMFSGPFRVAHTDALDTYPGTRTESETWGYADERGTD